MTIVFTNANLLQMLSEDILVNHALIVKESIIKEIINMDSLVIPKEATIIECNNSFLLPGLADMHIHYADDFKVPIFNLFIANGVTTIRSLAGSKYQLALREKIKRNEIDGPNFYLSGPILNSCNLNSEINKSFIEKEEIKREIIEEKRLGYDFIKVFTWMRKDVFEEALKTAKNEGMKTVGHIPYSVGLDGIIAHGMDEIAHIEELLYEFLIGFDRSVESPNAFGLEIDYSKIDEVMSKIKDARIKLCTTLAIDKVIVEKISDPQNFLKKPINHFLHDAILSTIERNEDNHQVLFAKGKEMLQWFELYQIILRKARKLAIPLILGTDAGAFGDGKQFGVVPGFSLHDELQILVDNGFSPFEAIDHATRLAAKHTGMIEEWGTIEVGKRADIILVRDNPFEEIINLKSLLGVMIAGKWFDRQQLDELLKI